MIPAGQTALVIDYRQFQWLLLVLSIERRLAHGLCPRGGLMVHANMFTVTLLSPLPDDPAALQALVLVRNQRTHCRIGEMAGMRF